MISILTKFHVYRLAGKAGIKINFDIEKTLEDKVRTVTLPSGNKIVFSWLFDGGRSVVNACALIPGYIIVNSEWAARLVLFHDEDTLNAFQATIGHELTHKENDFVFIEYWTKDKKFVNWVNEVHADFGAVGKSLGNSRNRAVSAAEYKRKYKGKKDRDTSSHPSWSRRKAYLTSYDFNYELLDKIAKDVGCTNKKLFRIVCSHFGVV